MSETTESQSNVLNEDLRRRTISQVESLNFRQLSVLKLMRAAYVGVGGGVLLSHPSVSHEERYSWSLAPNVVRNIFCCNERITINVRTII